LASTDGDLEAQVTSIELTNHGESRTAFLVGTRGKYVREEKPEGLKPAQARPAAKAA
jgi:hypothetical protein